MDACRPCPSDVTEDEWALVAPYLTLLGSVSTPCVRCSEAARLPDARRGFVLLPWRRLVERPFARVTRFRRLMQDHEGYASTLADFHLVALTCLMPMQAAQPTRSP